jgi:hypothetical protein
MPCNRQAHTSMGHATINRTTYINRSHKEIWNSPVTCVIVFISSWDDNSTNEVSSIFVENVPQKAICKNIRHFWSTYHMLCATDIWHSCIPCLACLYCVNSELCSTVLFGYSFSFLVDLLFSVEWSRLGWYPASEKTLGALLNRFNWSTDVTSSLVRNGSNGWIRKMWHKHKHILVKI